MDPTCENEIKCYFGKRVTRIPNIGRYIFLNMSKIFDKISVKI